MLSKRIGLSAVMVFLVGEELFAVGAGSVSCRGEVDLNRRWAEKAFCEAAAKGGFDIMAHPDLVNPGDPCHAPKDQAPFNPKQLAQAPFLSHLAGPA